MESVANYFKFNPSSAMSVDWYIGKRCNFSCSYCADYLHDYKSPHVPYKNMKYLVDKIYEKNGTNVLWSFCGGEPTIHPKFMELCKYVNELGCVHSSVTTNGSRTADYFCQLLEYLDNITISFHFEFMHKKVDDYIAKCIKIEKKRKELNKDTKSSDKTVIYRFMVHPDYFDKIEYMGNELKNAGLKNVEYRPISPLSGSSADLMPTKKISFDIDLTKLSKDELVVDDSTVNLRRNSFEKFASQEYKDKLDTIFTNSVTESKKKLKHWFYDSKTDTYHNEDYHYNQLRLHNKAGFQGWLCWAGIKHIKISPIGDIYIGSCHVGGKRGNIYDLDSVDLPTSPIRCPKSSCRDNLDLRVPKLKDWEHYHLVEDILYPKKNN